MFAVSTFKVILHTRVIIIIVFTQHNLSVKNIRFVPENNANTYRILNQNNFLIHFDDIDGLLRKW
jgi:hypothetical protein